MMQPIVFFVKMFDEHSDISDSKKKVLWLLEGLTRCNQVYLKRNPNTPSVYNGGIDYRVKSEENWLDIPNVLRRGFADHKDLAAFRCAQLRLRGIKAMPYTEWKESNGELYFRSLVKWPDAKSRSGKVIAKGKIEDPSKLIGAEEWECFTEASKMRYPAPFIVEMFVDNSDEDMEDSKSKLLWLLEVLTRCSQIYLDSHPNTVSIYDSGIVYQPEFGTEEWQDIPTTLERGWGDCEDCASYLCAELRHRSIEAKPYIKWRMVNGAYRFHALTKWPDVRSMNGGIIKGRVEDPSLRLGMRKWSGFLSAKRPSDF